MATNAIKPPTAFDFTKPAEWKEWYKRYSRYHSVAKLSKESEQIQIDTLLYVMGETAEEIFVQLPLSEDDRKLYNKVTAALEKYFQPKDNLVQHVVQFHDRTQRSNETNEEYIRAVYSLANKCDFKDQFDTNVKLRLLAGMKDKNLSMECQQIEDVTLDNVVTKMRMREIVEQQTAATEKPVDRVRKDGDGSRYTRSQQTSTRGRGSNARNYSSSKPSTSNKDSNGDCKYCGSKHKPRQCPAYGKDCAKCGKRNHFARVCKSKTKSSIAAVDMDDPEFDIGEIVNAASAKTVNNSNNWYKKLLINNQTIRFKVDSGAQVNIITKRVFDSLGLHDIVMLESDTMLTGYTGHQIPVTGRVVIPFCLSGDETGSVPKGNHRLQKAEFYVAAGDRDCLIGLPLMRQLGLVVDSVDQGNFDSMISSFKDVFEGMGTLPEKHHIHLKSDAQPFVCAPRQVAHHIKPKLKAELDRLASEGIIAKCTEPSEWVSPIVVVPKPNEKVRVCLDPQQLNQSIQREIFTLPTCNEILSSVGQSKFFSALDATQGFHQIMLDEESSKLTAFLTPYGRFRYLRLPFGLCSSPEVFHKTLVDHFSDIEGVEIYIDDFLVHTPTVELHDKRLKQVLQRCREVGLKLNKAKSQIRQKSVKFLGHEIAGDGLRPLRNKVQAVLDMKTPSNKAEVQTFLGFITYLGKFCPNLADKTEPLRQLIRKNNMFVWEQAQQVAFDELKALVAEAPVLRTFDPAKPITISVDASSKSLGAVLLQEDQPVEYAAKSLTKTQVNYAQIDKELMAVLFGCKKFHYYIYGKTEGSVTVETDHKPLLGLIKKPLDQVGARLVRILLELRGYSFNLVYKPGKELVLADTLSRTVNERNSYDVDSVKYDPMASVCSAVFRTAAAKSEYQEATANDQELQSLRHYVHTGWPSERKNCSHVGRKYWNVRHDISIFDDLLFYGDRLIIPLAKRQDILTKLHASHLGLTKTLSRAKQTVYWTGIARCIEDLINSCTPCQENASSQHTQPLIVTELPPHPYHTVGTDLFTLEDDDYLITVDYYTKWVNVDKLSSTTSAQVIKNLKNHFTDFGIPTVLRSDNGPQYSSAEFSRFMKDNRIQHVTSSPAYPKSNGQAEAMVKSAKKLLTKSKAANSSYMAGLIELRNTPITADIPAPAVLLQGRLLPSLLPTTNDKLFPQTYDKTRLRKLVETRQSKTKQCHDRKAGGELRVLKPGQSVLVHLSGNWTKAKIKSHDTSPRSYWVTTHTGSVLRRNRKDIRLTNDNETNPKPTKTSTFSSFVPAATNPPPSSAPPAPAESGESSNPSSVAASDDGLKRSRFGRVIREPDRLTYL